MDIAVTAKLVRGWVDETGQLLRESLSNTSIVVEEKSHPSDLVTEMDRFIEAFYVEKIRKEFPDHHIIGEEGSYGEIKNMDGYVWIIDPIDGTLNYVKQKRNFCSMIALYKDGVGIFSFINDVINNDIYYAIKGKGAYCNDKQLESITSYHLGEGLVALNTKMVMLKPTLSRKIIQEALGVRLIGSAGLEMVQVITNRVSAYVTTPLNFWDVAPGIMIASELGLKYSRTDDSPIKMLEKNPIIVANKHTHQEIINIMKSN